MKLVLTEPLGVSDQTLERLRNDYLTPEDTLEVHDLRDASPAAFADAIRTAEAVIIANTPLAAEAVRGAERLGLVSVAFTGTDHVPTDVCLDRGVTVSNCAGYATTAVAELVFGLITGLMRALPSADRAVRSGGTRAELRQTELRGRLLGIVGYGAIGQRVAEIALAYGMGVQVVARRDLGLTGRVTQVPLPTLLETSDIVSLHVPLTDETRGMIDAAALDRMKPEALLINTARGPVVDSRALSAALHAGTIRGAGLDVFATEPPLAGDDPLRDTPRTLLAPHVGYATEEALAARAEMAFENVAAWRDGAPVRVVVGEGQ